MRYFRSGQAIVEFALVLPLLLFILMGLFYFSMAFSDYLWVSNMARSSAREASLVDAKKSQLQDKYDAIIARYKGSNAAKPPVDFFVWPPETFNISTVDGTGSEDNGTVKVTIRVKLNTNGNYFAKALNGISKLVNGSSTADEGMTLQVDYSMYNENEHKSDT